jgi:hypothetical protein
MSNGAIIKGLAPDNYNFVIANSIKSSAVKYVN